MDAGDPAPSEGTMAETKQCRECKANIPKDARKCMHCGTKQGMGVLGVIFAIVFTCMVINLVAVSVSGSGGSSTSTHEKTHAQKQADRAKSDASILCMETIQGRAKFPSSVDFSILSSPPSQQIVGGGWRVYLAFESKNGFGNLIPQMATCDVINGNLTAFNVTNR